MKNIVVVFSVFVLVSLGALVSIIVTNNVFTFPVLDQIYFLFKFLISIFLYCVVLVLISFFRSTMRAQQFFFTVFLLSASVLPLTSILFDIEILGFDLVFFIKSENYFYIIMMLFFFLSALMFHYTPRSIEIILFFFVLILGAIIIRFGPLVLSTSKFTRHYFLGGLPFFITVMSVFSFLSILLFLHGLLNFEVKKSIAYTQTLLLLGTVVTFNIIIFLANMPYVVLIAELLFVILLLHYLRGYFYHAL